MSVPPDSAFSVQPVSNVAPDFNFEITQTSNVAPDPEQICQVQLDDDFFAKADAEAAERRKQGYDIDGKLGGQFSEKNPPPGMVFSGYLKGCMGIVWKTAKPTDSAQGGQAGPSVSSSSDGPGYCPRCGQSFYHYAGKECPAVKGVFHPAWVGEAPPSFSEVNK